LLINPKFTLPEWTQGLFSEDVHTAVIYGGRASGKTVSVIQYLILQAIRSRKKIVCARLTKVSISKSIYTEIKAQIISLGLSRIFNITNISIKCITTGSIFIFEGIERDPASIKGDAKIDYYLIDESDQLSMYSLDIIRPTLREEGSMLILIYNPMNSFDAVHKEYVGDNAIRNHRIFVKEVNWSQNPFISKRTMLQIIQDRNKAELHNDFSTYNWIWEGKLLERSDIRILNGRWVVDTFEDDPGDEQVYYGLDFGFAVDPTAIVRCYIKGDVLFITHELYKTKLEIVDIGKTAEYLIPGFANSKIYADCARPDIISFMRNQGYNVTETVKGTIVEGIAFLRQFDRIVIHSRCVNYIKEAERYSWKVDKRTGEIKSPAEPHDSHNHLIDATRYALDKVRRFKIANYSGY